MKINIANNEVTSSLCLHIDRFGFLQTNQTMMLLLDTILYYGKGKN